MAEAAPQAVSSLAPASERDPGIPLFLFCCFKTTGSSLINDEVSEVAVKCWPYQEDVPSFHYQILTNKTNYIDGDCKRHGRFHHAMSELCRWIEETVQGASAEIGTKLYPVLFSHGGDSKGFLFLFRSCGKNGVDLRETCRLPIYFADPVPLLELLKVRHHPLLDDSKYLTLGSLLNDWYPGMFNPEDLKSLSSRAVLTSQLYTQTTLYPVLSKVPIYNMDEWTEYYNAAIKYKDDKRVLESHMPKHLKEVQAKFAVRAILRAGYSWTTLLDLYQSCASPLQFRQEVRDMDVKSSIARDVAWMVTGMKLEQTGTRPYVLKIKKNMSPQEYIGYSSPRGYYFVLRVANKFPQCYLTLADLEINLQEHPIEAPRGFSLTQRLAGPESIPSAHSPGAWGYQNDDLFNQSDEDECIWEEEGGSPEAAEDIDDFLNSCSQLQMEHQSHPNHRITSFVNNGTFSRSLLLNCMEEQEPVEPTPTLSEEEQQRRTAVWASVRANLEPSSSCSSTQTPGNHGNNISRGKGTPGKPAGTPQRYRRPPRKGGGEGRRRRGHQELRKWRGPTEERHTNSAPSGFVKPQELPNQMAVGLPGVLSKKKLNTGIAKTQGLPNQTGVPGVPSMKNLGANAVSQRLPNQVDVGPPSVSSKENLDTGISSQFVNEMGDSVLSKEELDTDIGSCCVNGMGDYVLSNKKLDTCIGKSQGSPNLMGVQGASSKKNLATGDGGQCVNGMGDGVLSKKLDTGIPEPRGLPNQEVNVGLPGVLLSKKNPDTADSGQCVNGIGNGAISSDSASVICPSRKETSTVEGSSMGMEAIGHGECNGDTSSAEVYSIMKTDLTLTRCSHDCKQSGEDMVEESRSELKCKIDHENIHQKLLSNTYEDGLNKKLLQLVEHASGLGVDIVYPEHWRTVRNQVSLGED